MCRSTASLSCLPFNIVLRAGASGSAIGTVFAMQPTDLALRDLATRLLASESGGDGGMPEFSLMRVCAKLGAVLSKLAGASGYRSLLSRALVLAQAYAPALKGVHAAPDGTLEGLAEAKATMTIEEFARGETALVVQLLSLLHTFIGEPLTRQLLKDAWPTIDLSSSTDSPTS